MKIFTTIKSVLDDADLFTRVFVSDRDAMNYTADYINNHERLPLQYCLVEVKDSASIVCKSIAGRMMMQITLRLYLFMLVSEYEASGQNLYLDDDVYNRLEGNVMKVYNALLHSSKVSIDSANGFTLSFGRGRFDAHEAGIYMNMNVLTPVC
jgi:hypothetical protein